MEGIRELVKWNRLSRRFEKEIREEEIRKVQMKKEKGKKKVLNPETEVFKRSELLEKYTEKILFR